MFKLIESAFLMGLGAASITAKKAEEYVKKAIDSKEINEDEGNQLLKTILEEGRKSEEHLKAKIDEVLNSKGESLLPYYRKIQELEARVAALEAKIK